MFLWNRTVGIQHANSTYILYIIDLFTFIGKFLLLFYVALYISQKMHPQQVIIWKYNGD